MSLSLLVPSVVSRLPKVPVMSECQIIIVAHLSAVPEVVSPGIVQSAVDSRLQSFPMSFSFFLCSPSFHDGCLFMYKNSFLVLSFISPDPLSLSFVMDTPVRKQRMFMTSKSWPQSLVLLEEVLQVPASGFSFQCRQRTGVWCSERRSVRSLCYLRKKGIVFSLKLHRVITAAKPTMRQHNPITKHRYNTPLMQASHTAEAACLPAVWAYFILQNV